MSRYTDSVLYWYRILEVDWIEIDGWRTRGSSSFNPKGSVNHHTAGALRGVVPSLGTCLDGRVDVPGPLCQGLLGRDYKVRQIASGRANHAGRGGTRGMTGNSSCFGLEVEHVGVASREPIDWKQVDVAARIHAAWALAAGYPASQVVQHWEWTTRKIDFVKGSLSPDWFRSEVARYMELAKAREKHGAPIPPVQEDDDMTPEQAKQLKAIFDYITPDAMQETDSLVRLERLERAVEKITHALNIDGHDKDSKGAPKASYPVRAVIGIGELTAKVGDVQKMLEDIDARTKKT